MAVESSYAKYIDKVNSDIIPTIKFSELDYTKNEKYLVEVLQKMHTTFVEVNGSDFLDYSSGFVCVPAILRGRKSKKIAIGLVFLDLESSGEHYGSYFFTESGLIDDSDEDNVSEYVKTNFIPYDYWYTVIVEEDYHISFSNMPNEVVSILSQIY